MTTPAGAQGRGGIPVPALPDQPWEYQTANAKIRVRAVGLNPVDWKIVAGRLGFLPLFRSPPCGVGLDYAGEIVGVGGGATERHVGERVFGSLMPFGRDGACGDFIVAPYDRMLPLPSEVDAVQAAALPIAGGTALQVLADEANVAAGQRVLITGAAGGVGHFGVQSCEAARSVRGRDLQRA